MGIVIIPFVFFGLLCGIIAFFRAIQLMVKKQMGFAPMVWGFILSIALGAAICISYLIEGRAWALSPAFRVPSIMIILPFILHFLTFKHRNPKVVFASKCLLISVIVSTIIGVIYHEFIFDLVGHLGINEYH